MRSTLSKVHNITILKREISDILERTKKYAVKRDIHRYSVRSTVKLITPVKTVYAIGYDNSFNIINETLDYCENLKENILDEYCVLSDLTVYDTLCDKHFIIKTEHNY